MSQRVLVYRAPTRGQGIGNCLFGLVTALTLARDYDRELCVDWPQLTSFLGGASSCPRTTAHQVRFYNFGHSDSRDHIARVVNGSAAVVELSGNDVWDGKRRFPHFMDGLCATVGFKRVTVAAHVRMGDSHADARGVLRRRDGWDVLRRCLPATAELVADHARAALELTPPHDGAPRRRRFVAHSAMKHLSPTELRQTWSEWCMLRHAPTVYHTPSGFSESTRFFTDPGRHIMIRMSESYNC